MTVRKAAQEQLPMKASLNPARSKKGGTAVRGKDRDGGKQKQRGYGQTKKGEKPVNLDARRDRPPQAGGAA